jgi:hypothetical protein
MTEVFVASALRMRGSVAEKGAVVLRPGYVVFAPRQASAAFTGYASRMSEARCGRATCTSAMLPPAFADVAAYVRYLATLGEEDFDATVEDAIKTSGWVRLERGAARVVKKRAFFRRHKVSLSFETDAESVRLDAPVDPARLPDVERMLAAWA